MRDLYSHSPARKPEKAVGEVGVVVMELGGLCWSGRTNGLGRWRVRERGRGFENEAVGRVFWGWIGGYWRVLMGRLELRVSGRRSEWWSS